MLRFPHIGFIMAYAFLSGILAISVVFTVMESTKHIRVVNHYTNKQVNHMPDLRTALGKPQAILDGAKLGLPAGTACYAYQNKEGVYILCPS